MYIPLVASGIFTATVILLPLIWEKVLSDSQQEAISAIFSRKKRDGAAAAAPLPAYKYDDEKVARALKVARDEGRDQGAPARSNGHNGAA